MPSVPFFNVRFTPSWFMIILSMLVISLFMRLGFWQIQRAEEKEGMLRIEALRSKQEPVRWQGEQVLPLQYQRLIVTGQYRPELFLLDNQHQNHQFGYDVLSPLVLDNGVILLIDRGWIVGDHTRRAFPPIITPQQPIQVRGTVYFPSAKQWLLGPSVEKKTAQLAILENIDTKKVSQILQKSVYPFIIRLDREEEYGFVRQWPTVSMSPQRHWAYAWQWFAMALVVFVIFLALNLKKYETKSE